MWTLLGSILKSAGKMGRAQRANGNQACQRPEAVQTSLPALSFLQSQQIVCMAFSIATQEKTQGGFFIRKKNPNQKTQHLPWLFSIAGQEHNEWILVVFAGCTVFCVWVDQFKSLTFDTGSLGIPWFCKLENLELRLLKESQHFWLFLHCKSS